jgi:hypothetical protein
MNKEYLSKRRENKMSVLLKYYIQKIFYKINTPKKSKREDCPNP